MSRRVCSHRVSRTRRAPLGRSHVGGGPEAVRAWGAFTAAVSQRREQGRHVYGDRSFHRAPEALVGEIAEELLDVAGWAFILWVRLDRMRAAVAS
jgi:hypothetical protein